MSKSGKWICSLIGLVALVLVAIAGIVIYIDPFFQYHKPLDWFPYQVDNQLSQNPGMAKNFDYDSIVLGSSMTVNFNASWFEELMGLNTLKLNYNGAYPKDQSNILKVVYKNNPNIKAVFLGIDILSYSGLVDEVKYPIPSYLYDDNKINDVSYWWNKQVLLEYIAEPILSKCSKTDLNEVYATWYMNHYCKESVLGSYTLPIPVKEELEVDYYIPNIKKNMDVNICPYIEEHPETQFYIFFPPYSILYWNDVTTENRLEAVLKEFEYISERLLQYDNVHVYFFQNQEWIIEDLDHYMDYNHYNKDINYYMAQSFVSGECEITETNLENEVDKLRQIALHFDYEEILKNE